MFVVRSPNLPRALLCCRELGACLISAPKPRWEKLFADSVTTGFLPKGLKLKAVTQVTLRI
jgi:hypothetical protein